MEMTCVSCEAWTVSLNIVHINLVVWSVNCRLLPSFWHGNWIIFTEVCWSLYQSAFVYSGIIGFAACFDAGFLRGLSFDSEDVGDMIFRKVGWLSTGYTALYLRRRNSSQSGINYFSVRQAGPCTNFHYLVRLRLKRRHLMNEEPMSRSHTVLCP
jgi:hypothetical protein